MCGVAGIVSSVPIQPTWLRNMADLAKHRGPDDEGYVVFGANGEATALAGVDTMPSAVGQGFLGSPQHALGCDGDLGRVALAFRRLAIVDLSALGHQPMTLSGKTWICYNGEIYNHLELRNELVERGWKFRSHSDTEVLLAMFEEHGTEAFHRLNGMWGLAIHDLRRKTITLARDRFGVKPMYYWRSPAGFIAFASEIKQFTRLPGWKAVADAQGLYDFLVWGLSDHRDKTMFDGVFQVPPGGVVTIDVARVEAGDLHGAIGSHRWYRIQRRARSGLTLEHAGQGFRELFDSACALRLRSDVPVGSCLSGGLDSSSIVCSVNAHLRGKGSVANQKTCSVRAEDPRYDESRWIQSVVDRTAVESSSVVPSLDGLRYELGAIAWHQDEPFGSTGIYAQWCVFRLAAEQQLRVMLDGQGGDEQLAGYHGFFRPHLLGTVRTRGLGAGLREMAALKRVHGYPYRHMLKLLASAVAPQAISGPARRMLGRRHGKPAWINLEALGAQPSDPFEALGGRAGSIVEMSEALMGGMLLQRLLHWEDRNSMAHAIESRLPFLDYRLVEYVLSLPDSFKIRDGVTKVVLREAMRGLLPEDVRTRNSKLGFATPEQDWLRHEDAQWLRQRVEDAVGASGGVLREGPVGELVDELARGARAYDQTIWRLISFGEWARAFDVSIH